MVRRVGFGGDEQPNERDAELRRKYHQEDGNHSERAHPPAAPEPVQQRTEPTAQPQPRPQIISKQMSGWRVIRNFIVGFWILSFILGIFGQVFGSITSGHGLSSGNIVLAIFSILFLVRGYKFLTKILSAPKD